MKASTDAEMFASANASKYVMGSPLQPYKVILSWEHLWAMAMAWNLEKFSRPTARPPAPQTV